MKSEFDDLEFLVRVTKKHPPLTREAEQELSRKAIAGDKRARELMVAHNLGLVITVARKYMGHGVRLEDLVQEGNIGLVKAVEKFEPARGNRFSTHAVWWIRSYVQRAVLDSSSVKRASGSSLPPSDLSLDVPLFSDGEATHLDELVAGQPPVDEQHAREELSSRVKTAMQKVRKRLGERNWTIVRERLATDEPVTLDQLGLQFGLSRERVRQLEKSARAFLARYLDEFRRETREAA